MLENSEKQQNFKKSILQNFFNDTKTNLGNHIKYTDSNNNNGLILISKLYNTKPKKIWFTIYEKNLSFIKQTDKSFIILSCYENGRVFKLDNDFFDIFLDKLTREYSRGIRIDFTVFFESNKAMLEVPKYDNIDISKFEIFLNKLETSNNIPQQYTLKETGSFIYNIDKSPDPVVKIIEHIQQIETSLQRLKKQVQILQSKK